MAVNIRGAEINVMVIITYRPSTKPADSAFFNDFADDIEHVAARLVDIVIGNLNIYIDDPLLSSLVKFIDIIASLQLSTNSANNILNVVSMQSTTIINNES